MSDFSNAQVGDKVFDLCYGEGKISRIEKGNYPIIVSFEEKTLCPYGESYDVTGRLGSHHTLPRLYWAKPEIIAPSQPSRLKPCPFCGITTSPTVTINDAIFWVYCDVFKNGCGATGKRSRHKDRAIEAWNTRI